MSNLIIYVLDELPTHLIPNLLKSDFLKLGRPSAEVVLVEERDFDPANFDSDVDLFRVSAATLAEMERNFFNVQILGLDNKIKLYFDFVQQKIKADFETSYTYDADDHDPEAPTVHLAYSAYMGFQVGSKELTFAKIGKCSIFTKQYDDLYGEYEYGSLLDSFAFEQFVQDVGVENAPKLVMAQALEDHLCKWANDNNQLLVDIVTNSFSFDY